MCSVRMSRIRVWVRMVMQAASMALHGRRGPPTVQMAPYRSSKVVPAGKHILDTQSTVKQGRRTGMITVSHLGLSCALLSFPGALLSCALLSFPGALLSFPGALLSCAGVPLSCSCLAVIFWCAAVMFVSRCHVLVCRSFRTPLLQARIVLVSGSFSDSLSVSLLILFAAVFDTAISTGEWSI